MRFSFKKYCFLFLSTAGVIHLLGCSTPESFFAPSSDLSIESKNQSLLTIDPDLVVSMPNVIVNRYASLAQAASTGGQALVVEDPPLVEIALLPFVKTGDLLLILQTQGAVIDKTDNNAYGNVKDLAGAGTYEWVSVASVDVLNKTIHLNEVLKQSYQANASTQVVRVPRFRNLTINSGASITAPAWDGTVGGVVVFDAVTLTLNGALDVSGKGFRGGSRTTNELDLMAFTNTTKFAFSDQNVDFVNQRWGGEKGESIAGFRNDLLLLGSYGRAAPANGGGGGNASRTGGGGGANGNGKSPNAMVYNGQGVMLATNPDNSTNGDWTEAWKLDPAYTEPTDPAYLNKMYSLSVGGGRGGYGLSTKKQDPTTTGHGALARLGWGGGGSQELGGWGGHPVNNNPDSALFFGGGGGAANYLQPPDSSTPIPRGGNGGGLIYVRAASVMGHGVFRADGENGGTALADIVHSGAGGAGAGGSIVLRTIHLDEPIQFSAKGGKGGDQTYQADTTIEAAGPGGGGGGGFVALLPTMQRHIDVTGGDSGRTNSATMVKFPMNGATQGFGGEIGDLVSIPVVDLQVSVETDFSESARYAGGALHLALLVKNQGVNFVEGATVTGNAEPFYQGISWKCTAGPLSSCPMGTQTSPLKDILVNVGPGDSVQFDVVLPISSEWRCGQKIPYSALVQAPTTVKDSNLANNKMDATFILGNLISIQLTANPNPIVGPDPVDYKLSIQNNHINCPIEQHLKVEFKTPTHSYFDHASGDGWDCQFNLDAEMVTCQQTPAEGKFGDIHVVLTAPPDTAMLEMSAAVFAPGIDNTKPAVDVRIATAVSNMTRRVGGGGGFVAPGCQITYAGGFSGSSLLGLLLLSCGAWLWSRRRLWQV